MFLSIRWEKCIGHVSGTYTFVNSVEWSQHYFRFVQSHIHITHSAKSSSEMDNSAIIAKSSISLDDMSNLRCCHGLSRNTEMHCNQQQMTMRCSTGISHMEDSPQVVQAQNASCTDSTTPPNRPDRPEIAGSGAKISEADGSGDRQSA